MNQRVRSGGRFVERPFVVGTVVKIRPDGAIGEIEVTPTYNAAHFKVRLKDGSVRAVDWMLIDHPE